MAVAVLCALAGAVGVRRGLDGWPGATSKTAGLVFAGLLLAIWFLARPASRQLITRSAATDAPGSAVIMDERTVLRRRTVRGSMITAVGAGLAGAALLCAGPLMFHLDDPGPRLPISWFPAWAVVVSAVAITEELVLRGALWNALASGPGLGRPDDRPDDRPDGWPDGRHDGRHDDRRVREAVALVVTTLAFAALHVPFYGWESVPVNLAAGVVLGGLRLGTGTVLAPAVTHTVADLAGWFLL